MGARANRNGAAVGLRRRLTEHVRRRLRAIQARHNFHPTRGARQIARTPEQMEIRKAYVGFTEMMTLVTKFQLDIKVPYDPAGLDPIGNLQRRKDGTCYVYFGRVWGTRIWKIGHSKDPLMRQKQLQTANQDRIDICYRIPSAGREIKRALLKYTRKYKSQGRGGSQWRDDLTPSIIKSIIRRLKTEGPNFLQGPPLKRVK